MNREFRTSAEDEKDDVVEPLVAAVAAGTPFTRDDVVPVMALDAGVKEAVLRVPFTLKDLISVLRSKSSKNHLNVTFRGSESTSQVT